MKNLSDKAMLVNLSLSYWSGKKNDRAVEKDIEDKHKTANAGKYRKNLIAADQLNQVQSKAGALRRYVYTNTTPWGDNGDRLLPAKHYMEFMSEFRDLKSDFDDAVKDFLGNYPNLVAQAPSILKTLYRPKDYPTIERMQRKFKLDLQCHPIPEIDDFRLEIEPDEIDALKEKMQQDFRDCLAASTKDIWNRIKESVSHLVERLSEKKPIFHDTLVTNISELITLLPQLNVTDNPDIIKAVEGMKDLVMSPDVLRGNGGLRAQKAKEGKDFLEKFSGYLEGA
jgi:hypothetical protein